MIKIITIDGPSGVGKGTISEYLSDELKWNYLNSGSLYRACLLYTSPSPRDVEESRMPSSA